MVDENLVREITELVVKRLQERHTKALVVYTDTVIGAVAALKNLQELRKQGFQFDVLMSRGAYENQNVTEICDALEPENLWIERGKGKSKISVSPYEAILVPALTANAVAHLAAGMTDTLATETIMDGLMRGKTVVISINGGCPDCLAEADNEIQMTEPLKKKLRSNLETLREYGAKLTKAEQMKEITMLLLQQTVSAKAAAALAETRVVPQQNEATEKNLTKVFPGKLLSAADVQDYVERGVIRVTHRTMVTHLAAEEAHKKHIKIEIDE